MPVGIPERVVVFASGDAETVAGDGIRLAPDWTVVARCVITKVEAEAILRSSISASASAVALAEGRVVVLVAERALEGARPERPLKPFRVDPEGVVLRDPDVVTEIGLKLFGRSLRWSDVFHTDNHGVFDKVYLPTQLAQLGDGIFFDERIVSSLTRLKAVPDGARVLSIDDLGGWQDLSHLDAYVRVQYWWDGTVSDRTLVGTALVPLPPVSIPAWERLLHSRRSFLEALGIPTSMLTTERAVLFALRPHAIEHMASVAPSVQEDLLVQLGTVCRRLDEATVESFVGQTESDLLEVLGTSPELAVHETADRSNPGVLERLGILDDLLVWRDIRVPPLRYMGLKASEEHSCYSEILRLCPDWRDKAAKAYFGGDAVAES